MSSLSLWKLDAARDRQPLIDAVLACFERQRVVTLGGEPGIGLRWIAAQIQATGPADLRIVQKPRSDEPGHQLVLGGTDPDVLVHPLHPRAATALIQARWQAAAFRVHPLPGEEDLARLVQLCDGRPADLVAVAERAARLGSATVVVPPTALPSLTTALQRDLARLCVPQSAFTRAEAHAVFGRSIDSGLKALVRMGWVRASQHDPPRFRCARAIADACRTAWPNAVKAAEAAWARWGAMLAEHAIWTARTDARQALSRHANTFQALAQLATTTLNPSAVNGLMAWAAGSRYTPAMARTVQCCADVLARLPAGSDAARVALMLAELARLQGPPQIVTATLAVGEAHHPMPWRVRIVAGRAAFNRGEFESARHAADGAWIDAKAHADQSGAAQASLLRAAISRASEPVEMARDFITRAQRAFDQIGGTAGRADASTILGLMELEMGRAHSAIAVLEPATRHAWGIRRGNTLSICCMAHELSHNYDDALTAINAALALEPTGLFQAIWLTYRARVHLALDDPQAAQADASAAVTGFTAARAEISLSTVRCIQALCSAQRGDRIEAYAHLETAKTLLNSNAPGRSEVVDLALKVVDRLWLDRVAPGVLNQPDLDAWATVVAHTRPPEDAPASVHLRTFHALVRVFARQVEIRARRHNQIHLDSTRCVLTTRQRTVDLRHRAMLWRLVTTLADRTVLNDEQLFTRVWAGERMRPASAKNRLRVAVAEVRKLGGMRDLIVRVDGCYRLAPSG